MKSNLEASLAWPDRFFSVILMRKRVWCNSYSRLLLSRLQTLGMLIGLDWPQLAAKEEWITVKPTVTFICAFLCCLCHSMVWIEVTLWVCESFKQSFACTWYMANYVYVKWFDIIQGPSSSLSSSLKQCCLCCCDLATSKGKNHHKRLGACEKELKKLEECLVEFCNHDISNFDEFWWI